MVHGDAVCTVPLQKSRKGDNTHNTTNICKQDTGKMEDIPPLIQNDQPTNNPNDKSNAFNQCFDSPTELDDSNIPIPELLQSNFPFVLLNWLQLVKIS